MTKRVLIGFLGTVAWLALGITFAWFFGFATGNSEEPQKFMWSAAGWAMLFWVGVTALGGAMYLSDQLSKERRHRDSDSSGRPD